MNRLILAIALLFSLSATHAQKDEQLPFQLPIVPDNLQTLQERSDYFIEHFWDFADMKKIFSAKEKMTQAFDTYLQLMPYASDSIVCLSVDRFMNGLNKQPADQLFIADLAESRFISDTAAYESDALYLRFINPVIQNKKIGKDYKLRYQHQATVFANSAIGNKAPDFDFINVDGDAVHYTPSTDKYGAIIFFNDPDCTDCSLAKLRLDADVQTSRLIENGKIDLFCIYPGEADNDWRAQAMGYPQNWIVGATPDVDEIYDIRKTPTFYLIGGSGNILLRTDNPDVILDIMSKLAPPRKSRKAADAQPADASAETSAEE